MHKFGTVINGINRKFKVQWEETRWMFNFRASLGRGPGSERTGKQTRHTHFLWEALKSRMDMAETKKVSRNYCSSFGEGKLKKWKADNGEQGWLWNYLGCHHRAIMELPKMRMWKEFALIQEVGARLTSLWVAVCTHTGARTCPSVHPLSRFRLC